MSGGRRRRSRSSSVGLRQRGRRDTKVAARVTRVASRSKDDMAVGYGSAEEEPVTDPLGDILNKSQQEESVLRRDDRPQRSSDGGRHRHSTGERAQAATFAYRSMHHDFQPSVLSSGAPPSSYRGLLNLALILLILSNFRLVIANLRKYGLLVNFGMVTALTTGEGRWPAIEILAVQGALILLVFLVEKKASSLGRSVADKIHYLALFTVLVFPVVHIYQAGNNVVTGGNVLVLSVIVFMKLWSFTAVNSELHSRALEGKETRLCPEDPEYPDNVSILSFIRFMMIPSMVYQVTYPSTDRIRWPYLARRCLEFAFLSVFIVMFTEQYTLPLVQNTMPILTQKGMFSLHFAERVLKLGVPNLITWLVWFYTYFHVLLNILAEVTQFGDRQFYKDWWNATSLDYFWRTWNLPVHNWLVRHVYLPLIRRGWTKLWALFWTFTLSAVMHEYFVSPPTKSFKAWAFLGMMAQMPLIWLTRVFSHHSFGNIVFWFSILIGQPLMIMMYSHEVEVQQQGLGDVVA